MHRTHWQLNLDYIFSFLGHDECKIKKPSHFHKTVLKLYTKLLGVFISPLFWRGAGGEVRSSFPSP